jgi:formate/nitrite transporter FocA (FNT family)
VKIQKDGLLSLYARGGMVFIPTVLFEGAIIRLVLLERYESWMAAIAMAVISGAISLIAPIFTLHPTVSDEVVDHFFSNIRSAISFRPGILLIVFLNGLNFISSICYFLTTLRDNAVIKW